MIPTPQRERYLTLEGTVYPNRIERWIADHPRRFWMAVLVAMICAAIIAYNLGWR